MQRVYLGWVWGKEKDFFGRLGEDVCPKEIWGLNIKDSKTWNVTSVGKLMWQLATKKDVLWVKCIYGLYIKSNTDIWTHILPVDCSWYWKKRNGIKNKTDDWYSNGTYRLNSTYKYSVSKSYLAMKTNLSRVPEVDLIQSSVLQPKHRIFIWLAA